MKMEQSLKPQLQAIFSERLQELESRFELKKKRELEML